MPAALRDAPLTAPQADALREALAAVAAGGAPLAPDDLPFPLRQVLAALERTLAHASSLPTGGDASRPWHAVMIGVDRLAALRDLGGGSAERIAAILTGRVREMLPRAILRRTGRSTLEFAFACTTADGPARLEALHAALQARMDVDGQMFELPIAIGFARAEPGAPVDTALLEAAEEALAQARAEHLTVVEFDEAARARRSDHSALMRDLRTALETDALRVFYQPKMEARSGRIASAEALLRWSHPDRGMVPPDLFVGLAEQTGEIRRVTERVFECVLADQVSMAAAGAPLTVDINISGALLCDAGFTAWAMERIAGAAHPIGLEITETAAISDPERAIRHMRAFADAGVRIALDDYGSGLSSLAYLKRLPAHELKIDKAFVLGLTSSARDPLIVRSTIELAHALEMGVTAEGVDNPTARALLTVMGCDRLQGFGIAPPMPPDALVSFLAGREIDGGMFPMRAVS